MFHRHIRLVPLIALPLVFLTAPSLALTTAANREASPTRAQVGVERDAYVRSHPAPEVENWAFEADAPGSGMNTRADVKAERDASRRMPGWDTDALAWLNPAIAGTGTDQVAPTRAQVRTETRDHMQMHRRDELDAMSNGSVGGP